MGQKKMPLNFRESARCKDILVVEDNPGDVRLIREALRDARIPSSVQVARDGMEAMAILQRQGEHAGATRPDLIMLDLNLPKKGGWDVLKEIKLDDSLKSIPVVVLTASEADEDISRSYQLHANCFVTKPGNLDEFLHVVTSIDEFWLSTVKLERNHHDG
jgi:chemotaxis family two-component system response regulator Rcp1